MEGDDAIRHELHRLRDLLQPEPRRLIPDWRLGDRTTRGVRGHMVRRHRARRDDELGHDGGSHDDLRRHWAHCRHRRGARWMCARGHRRTDGIWRTHSAARRWADRMSRDCDDGTGNLAVMRTASGERRAATNYFGTESRRPNRRMVPCHIMRAAPRRTLSAVVRSELVTT